MAIELEIRDGSPHWYLSPNIWVVMDPSDTIESMPIAGTPCYLKARVRNNGSTTVANATVKFYWANPSIGVTRSTATLIGQSFVSLAAGGEDDVLCLIPWVPVFLNEGHECVIAEAYHSSDPLPATTDFNVPTDRHVAQRNLSVLMAMNSIFHMNFEMHNGQRKEEIFTAQIEQVGSENIIKEFPFLKEQLRGKKEGILKTVEFTNTQFLEQSRKQELSEKSSKPIAIGGFEKRKLAIVGQMEGDFVFLVVLQCKDEIRTGGLGILVINKKS